MICGCNALHRVAPTVIGPRPVLTDFPIVLDCLHHELAMRYIVTKCQMAFMRDVAPSATKNSIPDVLVQLNCTLGARGGCTMHAI